ncbi:MAG TPA: sensor domain-containing protein [Holophagaceae bacterium]|nr:sensor domain-containing protein [Holophagaceae bacterium]
MTPSPAQPGFLEMALEPRAYAALAYQVAGLPLGIATFTWVTMGLSLSFGLAFIGIGLFLGLAYLMASRALAVGQGRLAAYLVDAEGPTALALPAVEGFWARLGALLKDPASWGAQAYLLLRLPLGIFGFTVLITLLAGSLATLFLGLYPWYEAHSGGAGMLHLRSRWGSVEWGLGSEVLVQAFLRHPASARLTAAALGFVGFLGTLHAALGLTRLEAFLARTLLRGRRG